MLLTDILGCLWRDESANLMPFGAVYAFFGGDCLLHEALNLGQRAGLYSESFGLRLG